MVLIVTGAAGGIGSRLCEHFRSAGVNVVGLDKTSGEFVSEIVDLSEIGAVRRVGKCILSGPEHVEGIVHVAGIQTKGSVGAVSSDSWLEALNVNVRSIDCLTTVLLPKLQLCGGSVVCVGSVHTTSTSVNAVPYAVSKHALLGWARSAAIELAASGVRVNVVSPGAIMTEMLREGLSRRSQDAEKDDLLGKLESRTPLGRIGSPGDLFGVIDFLLDDSSAYVTGANYIVDGGATLCLGTEL